MDNKEIKMQQDFIDESGKSTVIVDKVNETKSINIPKGKYKLVDNIKNDSNKYLKERKEKGILTSDIGVHSEGFAPIITLSTIIAISIMTILYIMFRLR